MSNVIEKKRNASENSLADITAPIADSVKEIDNMIFSIASYTATICKIGGTSTKFKK